MELLRHIQLGVIEVDLIPGQAEHFSPTQAEDEDQEEGRVEGFASMPGRFEEPPGVINGPGLALAALSWLGQTALANDRRQAQTCLGHVAMSGLVAVVSG